MTLLNENTHAGAGPSSVPDPAAHDGLDRDEDGMPLAYRSGIQRFLGVELLVDDGALVPRQETELLGRTALEHLRTLSPTGDGVVVVDLCCGCGNLACGLAAALPGLRVHAADLTDGCVSLSRRNVVHVGVAERVQVHQGDLFAAFDGTDLAGRVDVIVANPPYISSGRLEKDRAVLTAHEPREAFDGGPYGLTIHQRLINDAVHWLRPGGRLFCEMGLGQGKQLRRLFDRVGAYSAVSFACDEAGNERVAMASVSS
ncbi:MAG: peptide chain release factor N(5)-glutamine methyltransferase [Acidimicrobiales bacterium]|nr:peptide chain release factor N(5)-glutamine methyltransferase [Acidimicrobiales bacterium]